MTGEYFYLYIKLILKATAAYELAHDAGGWNLFIADGDKVAQELKQSMGLGILGAVFLY
jgi:hypothetical protein